jgi:response regulator RpfG family c-di-GMP phosphodiesterase
MYPDTIRMLLSAYEDFSVTRQAINAGAIYKFIEKPWKREELRRIVEDAYLIYTQGDARRKAVVGEK